MQHGETVTRVNKLESQAQTLRDSARQANAALHAAQAAKVRYLPACVISHFT